MTVDTNTSPTSTDAAEVVEQPAALHALRARYRASRDLFSCRQMDSLCFLRWLIQTGRLEP
jgi:hypothetical protein